MTPPPLPPFPSPPRLIAEIGVNHEGDPWKARKLGDLAIEAGANAIKIQLFTRESRPERAEFALDIDQILYNSFWWETHHSTPTIATVVTEDTIPWLDKFGTALDSVKIHSGGLKKESLVRGVAAVGLPLILSTGKALPSDIDTALEWVHQESPQTPIMIFHCVSAYPTPISQANLLSIPYLSSLYHPIPVGYSNHVVGIEAPLAAAALGAQSIEVHFTDDRRGKSFRDHLISLDPKEMRELAEMLPLVRSARGEPGKFIQICEGAQ